MNTPFYCYATCPRGIEDLLIQEVSSLVGTPSSHSIGAVYFRADLRQIYEFCLWSRVANRVFLCLLSPEESGPVEDDLALYRAITEIDWETKLSPGSTLAVDFVGTNKAIKNTQFGAVRVKDAIVDRLRQKSGERPNIDKTDPDIRIQVRLHKGRIQVGLDLGGGSLHQRGYRVRQGPAPIKENLAAAILWRSGWPELSADGLPLIDPMCGAGTFLIEAAMMMLEYAPGLLREKFGFEAWRQHSPTLWSEVVKLAEEKHAEKKASKVCPILGLDANQSVLSVARENILSAGFSDYIELRCQSVEAFVNPFTSAKKGLVLCNPPYGERLGEIEELKATYLHLAKAVKTQCPNWRLGVLTGNTELAKEMRLRPKKVNKLFNGALPVELYVYELLPPGEGVIREDGETVSSDSLSEGAQMVFNRLRKNDRKLQSWAKKQRLEAYRIYDADMPEYAAAVDWYRGKIHVQEYAPPKTVNEELRKKRLRELLRAVAAYYQCSVKSINVKVRQKNSGKQQYEKHGDQGEYFLVQEGDAKLQVNLTDYLDSGLFLDHRPLRLRLRKEAQGRKFLNLFCYTASATVHAALGGARESVSVDMSRTYLEWASRNFKANSISSARHQLVQADCLKWLSECREGFDLILLDPPSFSNSKRMDGVLDVQKDHPTLIARCMELLSPGGTLYFSNNLRSFKLDPDLSDRFQIENISAETIDVDFKRNPKIHYCFKITHRRGE